MENKRYFSRCYCCTGNLQNVITPEIYINFPLLFQFSRRFCHQSQWIFFLLLFANLNIMHLQLDFVYKTSLDWNARAILIIILKMIATCDDLSINISYSISVVSLSFVHLHNLRKLYIWFSFCKELIVQLQIVHCIGFSFPNRVPMQLLLGENQSNRINETIKLVAIIWFWNACMCVVVSMAVVNLTNMHLLLCLSGWVRALFPRFKYTNPK